MAPELVEAVVVSGVAVGQQPHPGDDHGAADRAAAALGFGLEHPQAIGDPLPGPEGTILVAGGLALWLVALLLRPRRREVEVDAGRSGIHPLSPEQQLAQYERLRERGTLSDAEFEGRRERLLGVPRPEVERSS